MAPLRVIRQSMLFSTALRRTAAPAVPVRRIRFYSNEAGYGDSASPAADHPKQQGQRPHRELEHPGPEPVAEGRPKHTARDSPSYSSSFSGEGSNTPQASGKSNAGDSTSGPQPKILDQSRDTPNTKANPEVEKHNREMSKGSEVEATDEKVDKRFWTGAISI